MFQLNLDFNIVQFNSYRLLLIILQINLFLTVMPILGNIECNYCGEFFIKEALFIFHAIEFCSNIYFKDGDETVRNNFCGLCPFLNGREKKYHILTEHYDIDYQLIRWNSVCEIFEYAAENDSSPPCDECAIFLPPPLPSEAHPDDGPKPPTPPPPPGGFSPNASYSQRSTNSSHHSCPSSPFLGESFAESEKGETERASSRVSAGRAAVHDRFDHREGSRSPRSKRFNEFDRRRSSSAFCPANSVDPAPYLECDVGNLHHRSRSTSPASSPFLSPSIVRPAVNQRGGYGGISSDIEPESRDEDIESPLEIYVPVSPRSPSPYSPPPLPEDNPPISPDLPPLPDQTPPHSPGNTPSPHPDHIIADYHERFQFEPAGTVGPYYLSIYRQAFHRLIVSYQYIAAQWIVGDFVREIARIRPILIDKLRTSVERRQMSVKFCVVCDILFAKMDEEFINWTKNDVEPVYHDDDYSEKVDNQLSLIVKEIEEMVEKGSNVEFIR